MSINIHISSYLIHLTDNNQVVTVDGETVGDCLHHLIRLFPGIKGVLFGSQDKNFAEYTLLFGITILLNKEGIYPEGLSKTVKGGDEIYLILGGG